MDRVKLDNYRRLNPGGAFPPFRALADIEMVRLRGVLARRLGVQSDATLELTTAAVGRAETVPGVNAVDPQFDLGAILRAQGVEAHAEILLNWYRFNDIDSMRAGDVSAHFSDIWYPGSDDLELLDRTASWLVSVAHDGVVACWRVRE